MHIGHTITAYFLFRLKCSGVGPHSNWCGDKKKIQETLCNKSEHHWELASWNIWGVWSICIENLFTGPQSGSSPSPRPRAAPWHGDILKLTPDTRYPPRQPPAAIYTNFDNFNTEPSGIIKTPEPSAPTNGGWIIGPSIQTTNSQCSENFKNDVLSILGCSLPKVHCLELSMRWRGGCQWVWWWYSVNRYRTYMENVDTNICHSKLSYPVQ